MSYERLIECHSFLLPIVEVLIDFVSKNASMHYGQISLNYSIWNTVIVRIEYKFASHLSQGIFK